jgi:hypothetical protein
MAKEKSQIRPLSPTQAPDPASVYERAKPEKESGMGRMDNNVSTPERSADKMERAVSNKQPLRQINTHDVVNERASCPGDGESLSSATPADSEHSSKEHSPAEEKGK